MKKSILTIVSLLVGFSLIVAACNHSDDGAGSASSRDVALASDFGDLPWPCGPGDASGATDQGVTDTEIVIGGGDDRGFPTSIGLNKEQTQAVEAFVGQCNARGGINGRQIRHISYDAAITNAAVEMQKACSEVFMLVGIGFALDILSESTRVGCDLAAVPAWAVSADFAHGPDQITAVPNPADMQVMSFASKIVNKVLPGFEDIDLSKSASLFANFGATQETAEKVKTAWPQVYSQFDFIVDREFSITGEDDWTPWIKDLKDKNIELVHYSGSCLPHYQALRRAGEVNELDEDILWVHEGNFYETKCREANEDGAMNNTYIRLAYIPFEEASHNQATQDFIDVVEGAGFQTTLLGVQAVSSFLLWAKAASACGSTLTRDCVLAELRKVNSWNGHGLHVETNPAGNEASNCAMVVRLQFQTYERVYPTEPGTFSCPTDPEFGENDWRAPVSTPALEGAQLNANRISTKYLEQ